MPNRYASYFLLSALVLGGSGCTSAKSSASSVTPSSLSAAPNWTNPDEGLTDEQRHAKIAEARTRNEIYQATQTALIDGADWSDIKSLPRVELGGTLDPGEPTLDLVVENSEFIVVATIRNHTVKDRRIVSMLQVHSYLKGEHLEPPTLSQMSGVGYDHIDGTPFLAEAPYASPTLFAGDRVILLLRRNYDGSWFAWPYTSIYRVVAGRIVFADEETPRFRSAFEGKTEREAVDLIRDAVERTTD